MHSFKQETDLTGLLHLVKFYKSRRFDPDIGLPRLYPFLFWMWKEIAISIVMNKLR